jgi:hypothetical protein
MPLIGFSTKHGRTLDDVRRRMGMAVNEAKTVFVPVVRRVEWSEDRDSEKLTGTGFVAETRVDEADVHVAVDVAILGGLLGNRFATGLKGVVRGAFGQLPQK